MIVIGGGVRESCHIITGGIKKREYLRVLIEYFYIVVELIVSTTVLGFLYRFDFFTASQKSSTVFTRGLSRVDLFGRIQMSKIRGHDLLLKAYGNSIFTIFSL